MEQPIRPWLTIRDAADYACVSEDWIRRRIYRGELTATNIASRKAPRWRINAITLEKFLNDRKPK